MPVESPSDRLSFLSPDEFGAFATYTPFGGPAVPNISGILNRAHFDSNVSGADVTTSDTQSTFVCRSADLPVAAAGADAGDTLTIGPDSYRVIDLQPDGTGMTFIVLGR